jgi:excisionase family DNA binding protein
MTSDTLLRTLNLDEAAKFLKMHKATLGEKARANQIPSAKPGRSRVFLEIDLVAYLRAQYGQPLEVPCPSTSSLVRTSGTSTSRTLASLGYVSRLDTLIAAKRRKSTTN